MQKHPATNPSSRPFLKWAGGKQRVLNHLLPLLPPGNRLIEPFVGAGSVFLAADFPSYVINDANTDLVAVWSALQCRPAEFIQRAAQYFTPQHWSQEAYLQVRDEFNSELDRFERAVRLPYLNKFGFNGLFRVNSRGQFNVPYGKPSRMPYFPYAEMELAAEKLRSAVVLGGGYAAAIEMAGPGDAVYCDPPYLDSVGGKSFTGYTSSRFSLEQHKELVARCQEAANRGAVVLISNHSTAETRALYSGWEIKEFHVARTIAASNEDRRDALELLAKLS